MLNIENGLNWVPEDESIVIRTIDAHTCGEPLRAVISGFPEIKGNTIIEKRKFAKENSDNIRRAIMLEPRGHADMYGAIITDPERIDSDFGVLFTHNEGFSTMCGHGIIALTKAVLQTGLIKMKEPVTKISIDTPAGQVKSYAEIHSGKIGKIYFENVPSFVFLKNKSVNIPESGEVKFDIAFGGAFYAFVDADELGIELTPDNYRDLIDKGMLIKNAVMKNFEITHPFDDELSFLYGTIFVGKPIGRADSRNVCVFADGEVDRSPTGTGVSARLALHYYSGDIKLRQSIKIESIIGTSFTGSVEAVTDFGGYPAVIPRIEGTASIIGLNNIIISPDDELKDGFILR